jgi:hypothetical protein
MPASNWHARLGESVNEQWVAVAVADERRDNGIADVRDREPGEAPSRPLVILQYVLLAGALISLIGPFVKYIQRKRSDPAGNYGVRYRAPQSPARVNFM